MLRPAIRRHCRSPLKDSSVVFIVIVVFMSTIARSSDGVRPKGSLLRHPDMSVALSTKTFRITINERGNITGLYDIPDGQEYLAINQPSPLLSLKISGKVHTPSRMEYDIKTRLLNLEYSEINVFVSIKTTEKSTHLVLEVVDVRPSGRLDAVIWGPYATTIAKTVGEIVGVVRDDDFAIGIQALNVKTVGGYPLNDEGVEPSRGSAAEQKKWGSVLQAYSLDRSRPRRISVWNEQWPNMPVPPIVGESVLGSEIALFGCREDWVLNQIGSIEIAEGLPHPLINGVWSKISPETGRSYLIANYSESDIDELLGYTKRANLMTLYHMEPFTSWGHFEISPKYFPHGVEGLKKCVEKAKAVGIRLGAHVLTNFIQTIDPYVTPIPDPRLMMTGSSELTLSVDSSATDLPVASPEYFNNEKANWLHTVVIGQELVRYRAVSDSPPWRLLDCQRGAFATHRSSHEKGEVVGKLADHSYNVFFPNLDLQNEIAMNLAKRFNETGLSQMDFDGREGCWASGQGDYAEDLFTKVFYDNLDHTVINGTSTSSHFYWHINTYCNWGEPWYGGFRESMQEYRINNQALFERNYLPNMLGWYLLTKTTSLSEMEWMLARAAGYKAGFAMATSLEALRSNAGTGVLLDAIREWEDARRAGAFSLDQRGRLKDGANEFHFEKLTKGVWYLYPYHSSAEFTFEQSEKHPGSQGTREWKYTNNDGAQPIQFRLRVEGKGGSVRNPSFVVDNQVALEIQTELNAGESLVFDGVSHVRQYDSLGRQSKTIDVGAQIPRVSKGSHIIVFGCDFNGEKAPAVVVTFRTKGKPEVVRKRIY